MATQAPETDDTLFGDTRSGDTRPNDSRSTGTRPQDSTLISLSQTPSGETFNEHDSRHDQTYWGSLVLTFPITLDTRGLPAYTGEEGRWARDIWSKYRHMLGSVCSMGQKIARFSIDGAANPTEVGLGERGKYPDLPAEVPDWPLLSSEENPFGSPIRPFDELERLWLNIDISYSRTADPTPEDDFHDLYLKTELRAEVERPSMIPSKHELRGVQSRISPKIFPPVRAGFARALRLARRRAEVKEHVREATSISRHWAKEFASDAREETDYKERLNALHEEVKNVAHRRAQEMFEQHSDEEIAEELEVSLGVVRTCKRLWEEYMHVGTGITPSTSSVSPEEAMKDLAEGEG